MASDFLRIAIRDYILFFIFLGIIIPLGAGAWITSDVIIEAPVYSGNWLADILTSLVYFSELMSASANLQAFTGIVMIPFTVIIFLFIIETTRGH